MKSLLELTKKTDEDLPDIYCDMDQVLCNFMKNGKYKWLAKNTRFKNSRINLVVRSQKKTFAITDGKPNILIDDYMKNINEWEAKGGIGVYHTSVPKTINELKRVGFK